MTLRLGLDLPDPSPGLLGIGGIGGLPYKPLKVMTLAHRLADITVGERYIIKEGRVREALVGCPPLGDSRMEIPPVVKVETHLERTC